MMSIWFGKDSTSTRSVKTLFRFNWRQEYLKHEFVQEVLMWVDNCVVNDDETMIWSPIYKWGMPADYLSDGAKCLILLYLLPKEKFRPNIVICGLNCSRPLAELMFIKDFNVSLSNLTMHFAYYGIEKINGICENNGEIFTDDVRYGELAEEFYMSER